MNMNRTANRNRNTRSGLSYVYVSYVSLNNNGYVAVIDPTTDQVVRRFSAGYNPTAMCLNPSGDKLYVADGLANMVYVYSTDTFNLIGSVPINDKPVAIFVEPSGKYGYVANYGYPCLTVFDAITLSLIGTFIFQTWLTPLRAMRIALTSTLPSRVLLVQEHIILLLPLVF